MYPNDAHPDRTARPTDPRRTPTLGVALLVAALPPLAIYLATHPMFTLGAAVTALALLAWRAWTRLDRPAWLDRLAPARPTTR